MNTISKHLVVVGGGVAGCTAALEAANAGLRVTLIDEHPQELSAMSLDAPYFYGARLPSVLSDQGLIAERVLGANEPLMECLEAGVDVVTGTCVWANFLPGTNNTHQKTLQVGVADAERSWLLDYDYLILAPGSRDLVLSFPGWNLPGVLGANGANALLARYEALGGSKLVILGSGNVGLRTAQLALSKGISVAAIVEVKPSVQGDKELADEITGAGVPILLSTTVRQAIGNTEVTAIEVVGVDQSLEPAGDVQTIACDTICMAYGVVPNVELASVTGCKIEFNPALGGWIPALGASMQTSSPNIFVVGDGAGVTEEMLLNADEAKKQAQLAVRFIADNNSDAPALMVDDVPRDLSCYDAGTFPPSDWLDAFVKAQGLDVIVCQCEEVSRREMLDVSPPKYLKADNRCPAGGLSGLSEIGRSSQDLVKRLTRVGMGHCQGKRCRDQSAMLLAADAKKDLSGIAPGSYRCPVRPIPLHIVADYNETDEMRAGWLYWPEPPKQTPWK
ncbi:FAD-dependent oxidoreductase [Paraburkholderia caribensis]|uniref:(2Fe-2S)-binding protein n=1 Tax=Paraburkholderia caribensis TaxID=75105 RepID=A0A9Q6S748_9BURK|nr:FAD-dependent oxidoreductase [Paraburkholderia caribensis]MCO4878250.1 FAD-dependent oxidoreductase [Paraburkholderia caribensis]PTB28647.1 (2Fe-2S)-binding protein [Paraburkholderia caribensis]QLB66055.1 (2Fe-2S)-binding protein [Paraburkholderia caribensis]